MIYLKYLAALVIGWTIFGGGAKLALRKFESNQLPFRTAKNLTSMFMLLMFVTIVACLTLITYELAPILGWIVGAIFALWLLFKGIHYIPQTAEHALKLRSKEVEYSTTPKLEVQSPEFDRDVKEAIKIIRKEGVASTSLLKVHMRIDYGRAIRIIERLEDMGIVGPSDGINPRKVNL